MHANPSLGISHFLSQADALATATLALLLIASVVSWYLILTKALRNLLEQRRSARFLTFFWNAPSLALVAAHLEEQHPSESFSHLAYHGIVASHHHERHGTSRLNEAGTPGEFLTRTLRKTIDEETSRMESGLTVLASIGGTAPFVGLLGTVWGIYHALIAIGMSGAGTLDKVAGPVGEALIMTALGLVVAIPAVLGYNLLLRSNRVTAARLDAFAHDLFTFLTTGAKIGPKKHANVAPLKAAAGA